MRPSRRALLLALPLTLPFAGTAQAQEAWPNRPLRLLVPFPAGGATDILARILAERLGAGLGQAVVVDNRGGAGGSLAAEAASRAEPDGHTLFFASIGTASINPALLPRIPYRPEDFASVAIFADLPNVLVVSPRAAWRTLGEFLAEARARPGDLTYASSGVGSSLHLSGEMLKYQAGADILHVPFRGGGEIATQVMAGRISMGINNLPSAIQMIRDGALRALAVTTPERSPALPDVPTVAESGLPGYAATAWFGVQVPVRTPAPVVARLNAAVNAVLAEPETRARIVQAGARPLGGTQEAFVAFIQAESERWAGVIRRANLRPE